MVPGLLELDQALWICVIFEADIFCSLCYMLALLLPYPQTFESLKDINSVLLLLASSLVPDTREALVSIEWASLLD